MCEGCFHFFGDSRINGRMIGTSLSSFRQGPPSFISVCPTSMVCDTQHMSVNCHRWSCEWIDEQMNEEHSVIFIATASTGLTVSVRPSQQGKVGRVVTAPSILRPQVEPLNEKWLHDGNISFLPVLGA